MPKGKRKQRTVEKKRSEAVCSDDDSFNDTASVVSSISDIRSFCDEYCGAVPGAGPGAGPEQEENEYSEQEIFEDKLKEAIDGATQKSAKGRQQCLEDLQKAFASKYLPEFISERRETITDCIRMSLKKGKGEEQSAAATLAILLCVQLGPGDESEGVFKELRQTLMTVMNDNATSSKARAKCATCLGLCTFIISEIDKEEIIFIMRALESLFSASYLKGNGAVPNHTIDMTNLHSAALASWSLLLTTLPVSEAHSLANSHLGRLPELLESSDVELRITAGESIALFYEIVREVHEDYDGQDIDELCTKLKQLATDGHKYRAKKDRKQQRSSFRDILKAVEEKDSPNTQVKFGREVLELDSWSRKRQYDAFCSVLGSGMNLHLTENELLRDIFELGAPISANGAVNLKISKFERHMGNVAAFKARTIARNKVRDKRSIVIG